MFAGVLLCAAASTTDRWPVAQREHFLLTARIESEQFAGKGLTNSQKAMLTDGRTSHLAHIQAIDIYQPLFKGKDGSTEQDFKDSWKFNVAAYRLAKLLGLTDMTPVSVERMVSGKHAAVTWWVDNVLMDERERISKDLQPPDREHWNREMDTIRIFDQLIYNMDRSQENLLIDKDWNVWMIDHSRAFRKWKQLRNPTAITKCEPRLLEALQGLRREDVERQMEGLLTPEEIDGLMARRDLIVGKLAGQAAASGR